MYSLPSRGVSRCDVKTYVVTHSDYCPLCLHAAMQHPWVPWMRASWTWPPTPPTCRQSSHSPRYGALLDLIPRSSSDSMAAAVNHAPSPLPS